jgi:threonine dehydrogenase-like Zn-dependent dehydrogenase
LFLSATQSTVKNPASSTVNRTLMKTFVITEPGRTDIVDRSVPDPGPGEVLLRLHTVGFCGSDLNTYRGLNPLVSYPLVPGHEIGASIESLGEGVGDAWRPGQLVLASPYSNCGACAACRAGRDNCCRNNQTFGVQRDGAMSEYFAVHEQRLFTSETLTTHEMALVEPLTVGFHAVDRARVQEADTVAVIGCGAIGLGVIAGAASRGAEVFGIDVDSAKLEVAKACGATHLIDSARESLHDVLQSRTDGEGPSVVIEAVGTPRTFISAVEEVCYAGRVVYIGYAKLPVEYETKYFILKELDIMGSRNATTKDFQSVIAMLETGTFPTELVITETVRLEEAGGRLSAWNENPGSVTRIHVKLS